MVKKISVEDLKPGMYVVDTGLSWTEYPFLYTDQGLIRTKAQVEKIKREGYSEVFVDPDKQAGNNKRPRASSMEAMDKDLKGKDTGNKVTFTPNTERTSSVHAEIGAAKKVYSESLKFARDFMTEARLGKQVELERSEPLVENILDSVTRNYDALISITKLRSYDEYTFTHCINVAVLSTVFGKYLGLSREDLSLLGVSALFHDVGKSLIPEKILNKPGKLTPEEFAVIQAHPLKGFSLLKDKADSQPILRGILEHHEKHNGKGYPRGLTGDQMHPLARIIAVVDVYDALTSKRVYKAPMLPNKALSLMYGLRGQDFYPSYVERFIRCLGIYPVGSLVRLSNDMAGIVAESNPEDPLRPTVKIVFDRKMRSKMPEMVDLSKVSNKLRIVECIDHKKLSIDPAIYL